MSGKFRNKYRVASARAAWWDYARHAAYFITICTCDGKHFFGEVRDGKMHLSEIGEIAEMEWFKTPEIRHEPFPKKNLLLSYDRKSWTMLLEIPDHIAQHIPLNEKELLLEFAIFLYQQEILSMRAAADFAQVSWVEFERILAGRNIFLHYTESDLDKDLENLEKPGK
jgi:predicted HTH domain antitoxin